MTPATLLLAVLQYGPSIIPLAQKIHGWVKEGKVEVTDADWSLLIEMGQQTSAGIYKEAGLPQPATAENPHVSHP